MQDPHNHADDQPKALRGTVPVASLGVGPGPHRWASLTLAACGSSESIATLNTGKIERAIALSSLAQRGQRAQVSCPSAVPQMEGFVRRVAMPNQARLRLTEGVSSLS